MSRDRKLMAEIGRTMKKIDEGIDVFDNLYDKVYAAETQSQKLKFEGDLKKEIKKLQRLRDSIKTWASNNDIKDKTELNKYRKLIESKMEAFKICEKEIKILKEVCWGEISTSTRCHPYFLLGGVK